jgi:CheY-like chemotaxis protein
MSARKILVVDDTLTSLMWQRMVLESEDYVVITAKDGQEGVATARAERPDLILLDVTMPGMDGIEACRALRADPATKKVPVIMVATKSGLAQLEKCGGCGHDDHILKPFERSDLLAKVRHFLGYSAVALTAPVDAAA